MEQVLQIREMFIYFLKKYETVILFVLKFFIGLFIFGLIFAIGHPMPQLAPFFSPPFGLPLLLLMGVLFAVCPVSVSYWLIILSIAVQTSSAVGIAALVFLFLICVMFFYVRLAPKESALILAVYFGFYFKIPYIVPLLAGLYFGITSIIPVAIGVFAWQFTPAVSEILKQESGAEVDILELPSMFSTVYLSVLDSISGKEGWIFTAFIFAMVILIVFAISKTTLDYAKEIAVGVGAVILIISFIVVAIVADIDVSILSVIFFTIISAIIVLVVRFFDVVLDYSRAETVQFEDENNYYTVKVVPKIFLTKRKSVVKKVSSAYDKYEKENLVYGDDDSVQGYDEYADYDEYDGYYDRDGYGKE